MDEQELTGGIDRGVLLGAARACEEHWTKTAEREDEEQIARYATRETGWFWNRRLIGEADARKWHADLETYFKSGYYSRKFAARARYIAEIAEKASVTDIRLPASSITLLRDWLD